jgi:hypothetical protein
MLPRLKSMLRPLAVRLGLRQPLPAAPAPTPAEESGPPNPVIGDNLPPGAADLSRRLAERNIDLFPLDRRMIELQNRRIARAVQAFFEGTHCYRGISLDAIAAQVDEFRRIYLESPITMNAGGANFPSGINLFLMARCLDPALVVECGAYKGQSSYFLAAACPRATIHSFEPNLAGIAHRSPGVTYHGHDWMNTEIRCEPGSTGLCFFDDHQNQALRILQAHARGFRHVLVDDSWPVEVPGCGWPPLPSVDMLMNNPLQPGEVVRWMEFGRIWTLEYTEEMRDLCERARRVIKAAHEVPSLYRECGIAPTSAYKFVELN